MAHILLVEPDRLLAETYRQYLVEGGHDVVPCASAQAAILAADQQKPDVVILELQLIEHSGIEFLYEFRSYPEWQGVPVIVQTHVPPNEFAHHGELLQHELGVGAYLYKPLTSLGSLLAAVRVQLPVVA